jgi:hypothetical protein
VAIRGVSGSEDCRRIRASALAAPEDWAAQSQFDALPLATPEGPLYPCLRTYGIAGRVAEAFGQMGTWPLIDDWTRDIAVLVQKTVGNNESRGHLRNVSSAQRRLVAVGPAGAIRTDAEGAARSDRLEGAPDRCELGSPRRRFGRQAYGACPRSAG